MTDLNDLFKVIAEGKKDYEENNPKGKIIKEVKGNVKSDLSKLFEELAALEKQVAKIEEENAIDEISKLVAEETLQATDPELNTVKIPQSVELPTPEENAIGTKYAVDRYLKTASFQQPDPDTVSKDVDDIRAKIKFLEQAIGRIAATGPGGGEVNLRWLDDVKRETIADGRWLKYSEADKKFVFDEINPYEVVYNTTEVTTPTYTVDENDFYIGVNYAGPVTITLPVTANSGRMLIIKDEDGDAEINPITVLGNVDNDPGGFIIQMNNGAIQMIYRNGWRIV
jgi:hypothetical protein